MTFPSAYTLRRSAENKVEEERIKIVWKDCFVPKVIFSGLKHGGFFGIQGRF